MDDRMIECSSKLAVVIAPDPRPSSAAALLLRPVPVAPDSAQHLRRLPHKLAVDVANSLVKRRARIRDCTHTPMALCLDAMMSLER